MSHKLVIAFAAALVAVVGIAILSDKTKQRIGTCTVSIRPSRDNESDKETNKEEPVFVASVHNEQYICCDPDCNYYIDDEGSTDGDIIHIISVDSKRVVLKVYGEVKVVPYGESIYLIHPGIVHDNADLYFTAVFSDYREE